MHFLTAHKVNLVSDDQTLWKGKSLLLQWDPYDVCPVEEPADYAVDVSLFRLTENYEWVFQTLLVSNNTNTGHTNLTFPDLHHNSPELETVFPFVLQVTRSTATESNQTNSGKLSSIQPGIWSSVAFFSTLGLFSHKECTRWAGDEGSRKNELLSIDSLPPCPCTVEQAKAPNSRLSRQRHGTSPHFQYSSVPSCYYSSLVEYQ